MQPPSRRQVLVGTAGLAAGLAAGCTSDKPARPARVDPDVALHAAAVAREQALLAAYDAALGAAPAMAGVLTALRADHAAHLVALQQVSPTPSPSLTATPTATARPTTPARRPDPAAARAARTRLLALERTTAAQHAAAVPAASSRLAPVLASLAACESSHLVVL